MHYGSDEDPDYVVEGKRGGGDEGAGARRYSLALRRPVVTAAARRLGAGWGWKTMLRRRFHPTIVTLFITRSVGRYSCQRLTGGIA